MVSRFNCPLIIFEGGAPSGPLHQELQQMRRASVIDLLIRWQQVTGQAGIVVSDDTIFLERVSTDGGVAVFQSSQQFSFLHTLQEVISFHIAPFASETSGCIFIGGGALAVASDQDLMSVFDKVLQDGPGVYLNNYLSPDVIGWNPLSAIFQVKDCEIDNQLGACLRDQAGLEPSLFSKTTGISFDIDTVRDAQIAYRTSLAGPHFQAAYESNALICQGAEQLDKFCSNVKRIRQDENRLPELLLVGRVGPDAMDWLRGRFRIRVFSEERGMKGLQRDKQGLVKSFIADVWNALGGEWVLSRWEQMADAAVVDTRVLAAAMSIQASEEDRLWSDLGQAERIENEKLRELTAILANAPFPLVMGGHSIVSIGLHYLLRDL